MTVCIVGLGQPFGGDDGVGLAVTARVRATDATIEVLDLRDPSELVELVSHLSGPSRLVVVDALVGGDEPGRVRCLSAVDLGDSGLQTLSTHAVSVPAATDLARALFPAATFDLTIVGVEIRAPVRLTEGLSPEIRGAIERAARAALEMARHPL